MTNRQGTLLRLSAALAALLFAVAGTVPISAAEESEALQVRLEITDGGYKCLEGCENVEFTGPWEYVVEVDQGTLLALTFVWGHQGYVQEEHIMILRGYKLEWDKLDSEHREATVELIADKPGTVRIECDLDCELHDFMSGGHLKVGRGGGTGDVSYTPTSLTISPSTWATGGESVSLMTVLKDDKGSSVPKAEVRFFLDAEFIGLTERMEIGKGKTDANGVVFFEFQPTMAMREQVITARFDGGGVFDESEQSIEILETGVPPSGYEQEAAGLESIADRGPMALSIAIIAVWLVFAFVLYQALSIVWSGGKERS